MPPGHSHNARELVYRSLDAADQAEVRRHAFMICGNQPPSPREIRETRFGQTYPRERFDSTTLNGDDEGGSRSRPAAQSKAGVVGGHEQTDGYYAADVEKQDAYVHAANSPREIASRVLRFPGGNLENSSGLQPSIVISSRRERDHTHRDDLSADEREGSLGQNGPEAEKTPFAPAMPLNCTNGPGLFQ
jgi:hypothetical protein